MGLHPSFQLGFGQAKDILSRVGGRFTAANMQKIQAIRSLIQIFLITVRIAQLTERVCLDQRCGLGIVFDLADDLLHGTNLLSGFQYIESYYTYFSSKIKHKIRISSISTSNTLMNPFKYDTILEKGGLK